jgi:hypothetical protein
MALVAGFSLLAAGSCGLFGDDLEVDPQGFAIEPAAEPGPDAFTPSVATDDSSTVCDKAQFVRELQSRPDAYREFARVLGIPQDEVPAYVQGLTPVVLQNDTKVTNHGLANGRAYSRPAVMQSGTAVLVDRDPGGVGARTTTTSRGTTTSSESTTTSVPGGGQPVTRCKCGNPLLPPPPPDQVTTSVLGTEPPGTEGTTPGTEGPGTTRGTSTTSGRVTTSTTRGTTSSTGRSTTTSGATTTGPVVR